MGVEPTTSAAESYTALTKYNAAPSRGATRSGVCLFPGRPRVLLQALFVLAVLEARLSY